MAGGAPEASIAHAAARARVTPAARTRVGTRAPLARVGTRITRSGWIRRAAAGPIRSGAAKLLSAENAPRFNAPWPAALTRCLSCPRRARRRLYRIKLRAPLLRQPGLPRAFLDDIQVARRRWQVWAARQRADCSQAERGTLVAVVPYHRHRPDAGGMVQGRAAAPAPASFYARWRPRRGSRRADLRCISCSAQAYRVASGTYLCSHDGVAQRHALTRAEGKPRGRGERVHHAVTLVRPAHGHAPHMCHGRSRLGVMWADEAGERTLRQIRAMRSQARSGRQAV